MKKENHENIRQDLESFLNDSRVNKLVWQAEEEILNRLKGSTESFSILITPDQIPELEFPKYGKLIRVYGAQPHVEGKTERHPNSFQSLVTIRGNGRTATPKSAQGFIETSHGGRYWSFVPENVWHQPIAGNADWIAITFHSAPVEKLIDEYKNT